MPTILVLSDPRAGFLRALEPFAGRINHQVTFDRDKALRLAPEADMILHASFSADRIREVMPVARKAKWVHSLSAGVDTVLTPEMIAHPSVLTNGRGAYARPLGEWTMGAALFFAKQFRARLREQAEGVWRQADVEELHGRTMGIVGYGEIGRACAERARPFGMRIIGVRRRPELSAGDPLLDRCRGLDGLEELLRESDYVVLAAPSTSSTAGMIGAAQIAWMKPAAVLINVGRGSVIDEAALVLALRERRILGAALDVFAQEPLPAGHPLFVLDNVLLSPHTADRTPGWLDRAMQVFTRNLDAWLSGGELTNIVDKQAGY
ncbi:MAG: D-2-hydroxyacid dehydrogenase [Bryobacteraceae bacterium]|nr:D-2-hydroxyacid dehydrogenase [Bryobacteraceae bacterium]